MKEILSTVTQRGQVTIPAEVRRLLGARAGRRVVFVIDEAGCVRLKAPEYPDVASVRGAAGSLAKPLSWNEMQHIVREEREEAIAHKHV